MFSTYNPGLVYLETGIGVTRIIRITHRVKMLLIHKAKGCRHYMVSLESKNSVLEDIQINVKLKLAALWTSFMFYTYM